MTPALLHDLGHGAYSILEHLFDTDHEAITQEIIKVLEEIRQVLLQVAPDFPRKGSQCY